MIHLAFQVPLVLLLLLPLALLVGIRGWYEGRFVPARVLPVSLRFGALAFLILALAQPVIPGSAPTGVVFVVDRSASMVGGQLVNSWLHDAAAGLPAHTPTWQVAFAANPALLAASGSGEAALGALYQSNLEAALRLGLGVAPRRSALVVLSDGIETQGDAAAAALLARSRGVTIDPVEPAAITAYPFDAAVTRLEIPSAVHLGDPIPVLITVRSSVRHPATLYLQADGQTVTTQNVSLVPGDNPFSVDLAATVAGWHSYKARVVMAGDATPINNQLTAAIFVSGKSRTLLVSAGAANEEVLSMTRGLGFQVRSVTPRALNAAALAGADNVILNDVPASSLTPAEVKALGTAVRNGLGLVVLGGPHSLTLGKYNHSPLQQLLPVSSAPPAVSKPGELALELVLDRSGSMNDLAGGVPKIEMSQAAADTAVSFAFSHKDAYGLVSFDMTPHVLVPLQVLSSGQQVATVRKIVGQMTADGGTDIYHALKAGINQLVQSHAPYRHIILMTDGVSEGGPYASLLTRMHRNHITLSTVGMGQDADTALLKYLAKGGSGRYYYTNNANDLPKIFAREEQRSAGPSRILGSIPVSLAASSPVIRDLSDMPLPHLKGYPATTLKSTAIAPLAAGSGQNADPILAQWQLGFGHVLVWTPGLDTGWAGGWAPSRNTGPTGLTAVFEFWDDALRWAERPVRVPVLQPFVAMKDGVPQVEVNTARTSGTYENLTHLRDLVASPRNQVSALTFSQTAPGQYDAPLPPGQPGLYRVAIRPEGATDWTRAFLAVPFPAEYDLQPPDRSLLAALAGETGGRILRSPHDLLQLESHQDVELWWPLALAALFLFLASVVSRTLGISRWG